ncbi:MAG: histidinol-phosphate transaminase [Peptococcaceae bacterium]|nr:histidinol-phosphate transaminase [Peptococcaceae bacterium]
MTERFDIDKLIRQDLKNMEPYEAHYAPDSIRLDANENPHDFPDQVKKFIVSQVGPQFFCRYPDSLARELVADLALSVGVDTKNIVIGNGSDEIIQNLMLAFGVGKNIYIATPTFGMYGIHAKIAGAIPVEVPRDENFEVDFSALLKAEKGSPGIIIICSPNNPTGNGVDPKDVEALAKSVESIVVIDEAYIEFGGKSCFPLLESNPNLVILRTFSKAYGLAGLRIGYLLAGEPIIKELLRIKQPFNVNSFTQMSARSVIKFKDLFEARIKEIIIERDKLVKLMDELPGVVRYPSTANYIFFHTEKPSQYVFQQLMEKKIVIRYVPVPGRGDFLRVTVGKPEENLLFVKELGKILAG